MKKVLKSALMFAAASLAFAGCSKDATEEITPDFGGAKIKVTANATIAGNTRVDVGEYDGSEFPLTWGAGDALAVFDLNDNYGGSGNSAGIAIPQFDLTAGAGEKTATFEGEVSESADSFYAVYPYSAMFQSNPKYPDFNITFPDEQTPTSASLIDPAAVILVSEATSVADGVLKFQFQHIAAYAQMTLTGLSGNVKSIEFSTSKDITGSYYYYYDGSESKSAGTSHSYNSITVNADNLTVNGGTCKVLFSLFPVELSKFTVTVNYANGDSKTRTCTADNALSFKAGIVKGFTVDMSKEDVEEPAKDWSGNYVILVQDKEATSYNAVLGIQTNNSLDQTAFTYNGESSVTTDNANAYWVISKQTNGTYTFANGSKYIYWPTDKNQAQMNSEPTYLNITESEDIEGAVNIQVDGADGDYTLARNVAADSSYDYIRFYKWSSAKNYVNAFYLIPATYTGSTTPEPDPTPGDVKTVTVAEFNAAEVDQKTVYELTGTVSNIKNATYGNFDLTDATGTVYVYGLSTGEQTWGTKTDGSFVDMGIGEGDKIKIRGYRDVYSGTIEVNYGWLVEIVEKGSGTPEQPEDPEEESVYELVTNLSGIVSGGEYIFIATCSSDEAVVTLPNKSANSSINGELVSGTDFEISGNTLTTSSKNYTWVFNGSTDSMNIVSAKDESLYLGWSGNGTGMAVKSDTFSWTIEYSGNFLFSGLCGSNTRYIGIYHNNNHPWRLYTSLTQDGVSYTIQLYKKK